VNEFADPGAPASDAELNAALVEGLLSFGEQGTRVYAEIRRRCKR
jgi:hypothetical protein